MDGGCMLSAHLTRLVIKTTQHVDLIHDSLCVDEHSTLLAE